MSDKPTSRQSIEEAATLLAVFEGSDAFDYEHASAISRFDDRQAYRRRARMLLENADAYKVCRAIGDLVAGAVPGSRGEQVARAAYAAALAAAAEVSER